MTGRRLSGWLAAGLVTALSAGIAPAADPPAGGSPPAAGPREVFERRLLPILKSPKPSSCVQCHLAGVDLKDYLRPDPVKTFAALRDQGLVDLKDPAASKILRLIAMGGTDTAGKAGADLIAAETRKAELEAFAEWIKSAAADPAFRDAPKTDETDKDRAGPRRPAEVVRHARIDRVVESFERTVWPMRFRCMSCHTQGTKQCDKLVAEHGPGVAWFRKDGPAATVDYLLNRSELVNAKEPLKSPLLLKPLGAVKHGGGQKFVPGDEGYKAFREWLEDYAKIAADGYPDAASLPKASAGPVPFGSDVWLRITGAPEEWRGKLLRADVYAFDTAAGKWEATPIATSDRVVSVKDVGTWAKAGNWQHCLTLLAAKGSPRADGFAKSARLPEGRYLVKVYVDAGGKLAKDWTATLGEADLVATHELTTAWKEGSPGAIVIEAAKMARVERPAK